MGILRQIFMFNHYILDTEKSFAYIIYFIIVKYIKKLLTILTNFDINNLYFVLLWDKCAQKLNMFLGVNSYPAARQSFGSVNH